MHIIGLANRMALSTIIGAEGLGTLPDDLALYALSVIAGLGLSGAVTKMVADRSVTGDIAGRRRSVKFPVPCSGRRRCNQRCSFIAPELPLKLSRPAHHRILRLMPAAFIFAALSSILRSYSQGLGKMAPTALSQVAEQTVRVVVGLAAAYFLLPCGMEKALAGLFGGIIAGEIACLGVLYFMRPAEERIAPPPCRLPTPSMLKELFSLALPILLIRLGTSITQTVESLMIPARLQIAGFTAAKATTLFGELAGMALPLLFLPTVLIIPLNTTLVPAVAVRTCGRGP